MEVTLPQAATKPRRRPSTRRERWAWYLYDFGNSAYAAVVLLAVYSAYFKGSVVGGAEGSRLWGLSVGIAMLVVALISPILGALADFSATKKRTLLLFTSFSIIFTAMLFFVKPGDILTGMLFFILAEIGYRGSQVFYNALLPEIAEPEEMGKISGNGWAIGSLGGIVCLIIVLALITLVKGPLVVRFSFLITAVFFTISALPTFLWLREKAEPQRLPPGETYWTIPFKRLASTFRAVKNYKEFIKFIVAFLIYNDGIMMVMDFAAIIGAVLFGMSQQQLIVFMIIVQVTSVGGAYISGILADKLGGKAVLVASVVLMTITVSGLFIVKDLVGFYIVGALAGFALTCVQAVSRMEVGKMAPEGKSAEFYGFFAVSGHTSSFIGPAVYGWVAAEAAILYASRGFDLLTAEQMGIRAAVVAILVFLVAGGAMLLFVHEKRHIAALHQQES